MGRDMTAVPQENAGLPAGLRVLIVEDEVLLAFMLQDMLAEWGCAVVGPAGRVARALSLAGSETLDGAILDVNLAGTEVYPVARALAARQIPFIFVSGFAARRLPTEWRNRPILQKPFQPRDLAESMARVFAQPSPR
jgi:DNA-binding response OmpR family regulator